MPGNNNPQGKNQYGSIIKADNPVLKAALTAYHHELLADNEKIARRLLEEHNIVMSAATVKRRRRELGLAGSRTTSNSIPKKEQVQMVLDEMKKDPTRLRGPRSLRYRIAHQAGVHLTRDFVSSVMRESDPEGSELRKPRRKRLDVSSPRTTPVERRPTDRDDKSGEKAAG